MWPAAGQDASVGLGPPSEQGHQPCSEQHRTQAEGESPVGSGQHFLVEQEFVGHKL